MIRSKTLVVGVAGAVAQAATAYSETWDFVNAQGYTSVQIASTAGSITVTRQCSIDGTNFYDPVDINGNAMGQVVTAMTVGTKYITYDPVPSPYVRFKVVEANSASTVVTITAVNLE